MLHQMLHQLQSSDQRPKHSDICYPFAASQVFTVALYSHQGRKTAQPSSHGTIFD
jgi:hypothetical protein